MDGRLAAARLRGRGESPAGGDRARGRARAPDLRPLRQNRLGAHRRTRAERRGRGDEAARFADGPRGGKPWTKGAVYKVLANRIYLGEAVHKGVAYPGEHAAIIDQRTWDKAHAVMAEPAHRRGAATRAQVPALLKGLIFGPNGRPMSPSHTRRRGRIYRYYVTREALADGYGTCAVTSVTAADVEGAVLDHIQKLLAAPELVARAWATAKRVRTRSPSARSRSCSPTSSRLEQLFPAEQARIVQLLVERVDVQEDALEVRVRVEGSSLVGELRQQGEDGGMIQSAKTRARRHHARRADPDALSAPRRAQADHRPGRQRNRADLPATAARRYPAQGARARRRWQKLLDDGVYPSISDIAEASEINRSYVSRVLRLTLLAPDIIEQIVDDRNLPGAVRASDALPDRVGAAAFGSAFAPTPPDP